MLPKIKKKKERKKSENQKIQEISRFCSEFVEKTVLIRNIVRFLGLKKPYLLKIRTSRNCTNGGPPYILPETFSYFLIFDQVN